MANTIKADQEMCISDSDFQGFLGIAKNYMASSREHDGKPEMVKQIFTAGPDIGCMSRDAFSKAGYLDGLLDKYRLWAASVAYTPKLNIAYKNAVAIYLIEIGETYNRNVSGMLKDIITVQG
ncbi:MAG: hypothetical protein HY518_02545 [Candidatus Aenigmarchaeota archaeon]|nr:hypothetical protein [Candidatus Aenigmarchaeota archaeon]